jgi:hypothetical protein
MARTQRQRGAVAPTRRGDPYAALAATLPAEPAIEPPHCEPRTRLRWGAVSAREFVRWPGGGSGVPEDDPAKPAWALGMDDATPVYDAEGALVGAARLPRLARRPDGAVAAPRSALKGSAAAAAAATVPAAESAPAAAAPAAAAPAAASAPPPPPPAPLPGVLALGSVTQHQQQLARAKLERTRELLLDLSAGAEPSRRKAVPHALRLQAAHVLAAGAPPAALQLFRMLPAPERRARFEADLLGPGLAPPAEVAAWDAQQTAALRALLAGRAASNVGCTCAYASGAEVLRLTPKRLKAALAAAGLPTGGSAAECQIRLLHASRGRAGCMRRAPLPEALVAAGRVRLAAAGAAAAAADAARHGGVVQPNVGYYLHPHAACVASRHAAAHQPLADAHARGVALARAQQQQQQQQLAEAEAGARAGAEAGDESAGGSAALGGDAAAAGAGAGPVAAAAAGGGKRLKAGSAKQPAAGGAAAQPLVPADVALCPCEESGAGCHWCVLAGVGEGGGEGVGTGEWRRGGGGGGGRGPGRGRRLPRERTRAARPPSLGLTRPACAPRHPPRMRQPTRHAPHHDPPLYPPTHPHPARSLAGACARAASRAAGAGCPATPRRR